MTTAPQELSPGVTGFDLESSDLFFNRELSWLRFNRRVLDQALDDRQPLLERVKFLAIFFNNLDEFFMVRVSGLRRQLAAGVVEAPPDGMTPAEQLRGIRLSLQPTLERADAAWYEELQPELRSEKVEVLRYEELDDRQQKVLRKLFRKEIFPVLTPLAFDPGHPFPHISNLCINLAVVVRDEAGAEKFARLKVPQMLPRLLRIPDPTDEDPELIGPRPVGGNCFVWLEEVVAANLDLLFPGLEVVDVHPFRVTRDADLEFDGDEADDLLTAIEEVVGQRHFGSAVRLEVNEEMPQSIRSILIENLEIEPYQVYTSRRRIGLSSLFEVAGLDLPALKSTPFLPQSHPALIGEDSIFTKISRAREVVLYHPYDSFSPVVDFVRAAAEDPDVIAIKQTLYRVGPDSPIVEALMDAREKGKQVSVLVELKARFDESHNIGWAQTLEKAGVHVVYGLVGLKTHAKTCMVVRRERDRIRRYVHLGSGNYNPITARIYTDLGYFTTRKSIANDVSDLFNALTGYSRKEDYRTLVVAPEGMRPALLERIEREIEHANAGVEARLVFKMNALVDKRCIQALYRASQAGVRVDLLVRGICCLRPGIPGLSDNVRVLSIVGRFLEHARIYLFHNGGESEILVGSADLMPRNLDHRVEILVPIADSGLREAIETDILGVQLRDNCDGYELRADGTWERLEPGAAEPYRSQEAMLTADGAWRQPESPAG